jgi:hypothetical protein
MLINKFYYLFAQVVHLIDDKNLELRLNKTDFKEHEIRS